MLEELLEVINEGNVQRVKELINQIKLEQLTIKDYSNKMPLHVAVTKGNTEIIALLLDKGVNIDIQDDSGNTALMWACKSLNLKVACCLINAKANVSTQNLGGFTALMWACLYAPNALQESTNIIDKLINADANIIDTKNFQGKTALALACDQGLLPIAIQLIEAGGNITGIIINNPTQSRELRFLQALMFSLQNTDINLGKDIKGSMLIFACEAKLKSIANKLIENGANVHIKDLNGNTPLILACKNNLDGNHLESIANKLIENGANVNVKDKAEYTPLMWACRNTLNRTVELLIMKGANINAQNKYNDTALNLSCFAPTCGVVVETLIDAKADINIKNNKGCTPLMTAHSYNKLYNNTSYIIKLLELRPEVGEVYSSITHQSTLEPLEKTNKMFTFLVIDKIFAQKSKTKHSLKQNGGEAVFLIWQFMDGDMKNENLSINQKEVNLGGNSEEANNQNMETID